ncbi:MAG: AMP-binding protein, partial [Tepidiformaceae bacterium]
MAAVPSTLCATGSDTVSGVLRRQAKLRGNDVFLVFEDADGVVVQRTYAEVDERATRVAYALRELGVGPGDNFHVHLANCLEFFDCWFGAARLGAVMVPTNPLATAPELAYVLEHARCQVSITSPDLAETVKAAGVVAHLLITGQDFETALALGHNEPAEIPAPGALDPVAMLYTSGTTSLPKGVLVTNANYLFVGNTVAQFLRLQPADRHLIVLPLFHANAQYYSTMSALVTGASVAVMDCFSASRWSRQATRHGATIASLFAAPVRMILAQQADTADRQHSLRVALFAQNISEEQLTGFHERFGVELLQLYGMTETISLPTLNPLFGERRNMTIGRPAPWARLRVVDGSGRDVQLGEAGELLVGGELGTTLMAGYFKSPEATEETFRDGWLHTGDNVRADRDGYLHFVDRGKDMIKRAGENVASGEVERVLNAHP